MSYSPLGETLSSCLGNRRHRRANSSDIPVFGVRLMPGKLGKGWGPPSGILKAEGSKDPWEPRDWDTKGIRTTVILNFMKVEYPEY
ncbi:hypothetical protein AVEN_67023-1 [Araneus ventricosus]|uniref:Uncharacterized protein n=1 Tax=Araneus ventricosus TaxID=182803 RepID=A0A4Y2E1N1_ARAVE|nr:hypothetical protein AVEN_67023-1 [Araneus ventricosus]